MEPNGGHSFMWVKRNPWCLSVPQDVWVKSDCHGSGNELQLPVWLRTLLHPRRSQQARGPGDHAETLRPQHSKNRYECPSVHFRWIWGSGCVRLDVSIQLTHVSFAHQEVIHEQRSDAAGGRVRIYLAGSLVPLREEGQTGPSISSMTFQV